MSEVHPAKVWNEKTVKARKYHTCSECYCKIQPGETYLNISCLHDQSWSNWKQCHICHQFRGWLSEKVPDFVFSTGNLAEGALCVISEEMSYDERVLTRCLNFVERFNQNHWRYFARKGRKATGFCLDGYGERINKMVRK